MNPNPMQNDMQSSVYALSPSDRAALRVEFCLTYARTKPREFMQGSLDGPDIPDAYRPGKKAPGSWEDGGDSSDVFENRTEDGWVDRYANYAINEAIHEALEWFRVDGKPWLDPHGLLEDQIYALTNRLCDDLAKLRRNL